MPSKYETYTECSRCGELGIRFGRSYCDRCGTPAEIWSVVRSHTRKIASLEKQLDNFRRQLRREMKDTRAETSRMERSLEELRAKVNMLEDKLGEGEAT